MQDVGAFPVVFYGTAMRLKEHERANHKNDQGDEDKKQENKQEEEDKYAHTLNILMVDSPRNRSFC
jgi:hypothetical protein